jgi:hypothetical protein
MCYHPTKYDDSAEHDVHVPPLPPLLGKAHPWKARAMPWMQATQLGRASRETQGRQATEELTRRSKRIETAVVAGGKHVSAPHEAWIAADPFKGGFRVLITGRTASRTSTGGT